MGSQRAATSAVSSAVPATICGSFGCRPTLLRTRSRGSISLASANPSVAPRIQQNFFTDEKDMPTLRAGIRMARDLLRTAPLKPFLGREIAPGDDVRSDAELDSFIRATADTVYHPLGTCRMGDVRDEKAVVDPELRVRGVEGLRVVDASVMPDLVGGNINAPVIMIAERAADMHRSRNTRLRRAASRRLLCRRGRRFDPMAPGARNSLGFAVARLPPIWGCYRRQFRGGPACIGRGEPAT